MPWAYLTYLVFCGCSLHGGLQNRRRGYTLPPFFQFFLIVGGALLFPSCQLIKELEHPGLPRPYLHLPVGGQPGNFYRRLDQIQLCRF